MKIIFWGSPVQTDRVYSQEYKNILSENGMESCRVYGKKDIGKEDFTGTEIIFSTWGFEYLNCDEINKYFPSLKAVFYGAGSVQYFARPLLECGVKVFSAWGANGVPVAEFAYSQILLANKGYFACFGPCSSGHRKTASMISNAYPGNFACSVGIIGAGMIGKKVIRLLKNNRVSILVYDPFLSDTEANDLGVTKTTLEKVFSECQTVSNHLANNRNTQGIIREEHLTSMKKGAVFINTGRGAQIDEDDMVRALEKRPDIYALLDVTWPEPPAEGSPLYSLPNVLLTPHIAGSMGNETFRMGEYMVEEYLRYSRGADTLYEVTESMLDTMA